MCFWEVLPDELQHQQLVKIGVEQGAGDRVQLPVMIVRAPREINDHNGNTLLHPQHFCRNRDLPLIPQPLHSVPCYHEYQGSQPKPLCQC
jgi:hypothetical protein